MPEGPEARTTADELRTLILSQKILDFRHSFEIKCTLRYIIRGTIIKRVESYGKKVLLYLEYNGRPEGILVFYLGMTGRLSTLDNLTHIRLLFQLESCNLYFSDIRKFGALYHVREFIPKEFNMGSDLLQKEPSREEYKESLENYNSKKQVVQFLLDQSIYAGVGNYLKSEILYRAKVRPDIFLYELTDEKIERLRMETINTIRESYEAGGLTIKDYWSPLGNRGTFLPQVYNRNFDNEGRKITKSVFKDGRTTYWVEEEN